MKNKLLKSIFVAAAVLALAGSSTYALFTAAPVTIANNSLTTGAANMALCNALGANAWNSTVTPNFTVDNMIPGAAAVELSATGEIYLGNDGGDLTNNLGVCNSYGGAAGSSDVPLQVVPTVNIISCDANAERDYMYLDIRVGGASIGNYSLNAWEANTGALGPTFAVDEVQPVELWVSLDTNAQQQNQNCTFDVVFTGQQV